MRDIDGSVQPVAVRADRTHATGSDDDDDDDEEPVAGEASKQAGVVDAPHECTVVLLTNDRGNLDKAVAENIYAFTGTCLL